MGEIIVIGGKKYYEAVSISRDDLLDIFQDNSEVIEIINNLTDDDLCYIANKFGDVIMNDWREILEMVFTSRYLDSK